MSARWLLLVLLFAGQDGVQKLIDELRDGDIAARETAERRLIEAGPAALPALEPLLKTADIDFKPRLAFVIETIKVRAKRAEAMKSGVQVSLAAENEPFRDVMKRLETASGFEVWIDKDVEDRRITLSLKDAPYLDAMTRICRAHGAARLTTHDDHYISEMNAWRRAEPAKRAMFQITAGKSTREPLFFEGPFRVALSRIDRSRSTQPTPSHFWLTLDVLWGPNVPVMGLENLWIDVIKDDQGRDLIARQGTRESESGFSNGGPADDVYDARFHVSLRDDPVGVKSLSRVEGRVPVWIAGSREKVRLEPATSLKTAQRVGRLTVTISAIEVKDGVCEVAYTAIDSGKPGSWWVHPHNPRPAIFWAFLDAEGRTLPCTDWRHRSEKDQKTDVCRIPLKDGRTLGAIEITALGDFFCVEVPFRFADVPVPQW